MIYVLYSLQQKSFLKREAKKIIKSSLPEINDFNYASFDAKETKLKDIVNACLEVPLLENKKVVLVDDAYFLSSSKSKDKINDDQDFKALTNYINNPSNETDLIFIVYSDKLDSHSKLTKLIVEKAKVTNLTPFKIPEWEKYVELIISKSGARFDRDAIKELSKRTFNDRDRLINEIAKLALYSHHITLKEIISMVNEPIEERAFMLTNALLKADTTDALLIYRDLLKQKNTEPMSLLMMIANQFRLMYQVLYLHKLDKSIVDIANSLHLNEYRARMLYQSAKPFENKFNKILDDLYELDYKIKSGQADHFLMTELFIVNFKNNYC